MNPKDSSTERLSDVFIDRFDLIYMDYPESIEIEKQIVLGNGKELVSFPEKLLHFALYFIRLLREDENLDKKPSVRASIGLYERSQSNALLEGRQEVCFEDIRDAVISVLSHRIELKPSVKYLQGADDYVRQEFERFCEEHKDISRSGCR